MKAAMRRRSKQKFHAASPTLVCWSYAWQSEAGILTNLPLWSRRPNYRARSTKMPPSQSYKRRCVACQHSPDDQTLRLQAGAGEDDVIHLPSGLDRVDCEHQEEEEDRYASRLGLCSEVLLGQTVLQ